MRPDGGEVSRARPILLGAVSPARVIRPRRGGGGRVEFRNTDQRIARLDARFEEALASLGREVQLATSLQAAEQ